MSHIGGHVVASSTFFGDANEIPSGGSMPTSPRVRLRQRPPNPLPSFAGRDREEAALVELVRRSPVAVVSGPPGIGKTQLVLHAMRGAFLDRHETTLFVAVREDEAAGQLVRTLAGMLAECLGRTLDETLLQEPDDVIVEAVIDLAEQGPFWLVLDGIDHASDGASLLTAAAMHAHRSRWLVTARALPVPALAATTIELPPLGSDALMQIGLLRAPRLDAHTRERAARGSGGSPWLFTQLLDTRTNDVAGASASLRSGLTEPALATLRALAAIRFAVPSDVLGDVVGLPSPEELESLDRRGLIVREHGSLKVRDTVAELFFGGRPLLDADVRRALAARLSVGEPESVLDAIQLLRTESPKSVRDLLERHGETLLKAGLAPRLFRVLQDLRDDVLIRWRVRCAAELGNPTALAGVTPNSPRALDELGSLEDRLAWAHTKFAHGDLSEAESLAASVKTASTGALALRASILQVRCAYLRRAEVALLPPVGDPELDLEREALALLSAADGHEIELDRPIAALIERAALHAEAGLDVCACLLARERLEAASRLLARVQMVPRASDPAHLTARRGHLMAARIALTRGAFAEAEVALAAVRPYARTTSLLRGPLLALEVELKLGRGGFAALDDDLLAAERECARTDPRSLKLLGSLRARLSIARGEGAAGSGPWSDVLAARRGTLAATEASSTRAEAFTSGMVRAHLAIARGAPAEALDHASAAYHAAHRAGLGVDAAEAASALCDAAAASERPDASAHADRFLELARRLGSPRYEVEAEFAAALAQPTPGAFERLAAKEEISPMAARRARAVLGVETALDEVDRAVIGRARRELGITSPSGPFSPGWGLSERDQSVWLEDGRNVALGARPLLWTLLSVLAERGESSKEELVVRVWGEAEYHPLRHDARLQMSIRKLRELIEDDASVPIRLLTVEGGYRLGGTVRRATHRPT